MKKAKPYRPRRGLRFANGRRGNAPAAGFVAGRAISRSRPFPAGSNPEAPVTTAQPGTFSSFEILWNVINPISGTMMIEYITPGVVGDGYLFSIYPDGTGSAELQVSPTQTIWHYQPTTSTFTELVSLFPSTFMQIGSTPGMVLSQKVPALGVVNFAAFAGGEDPVPESLTADQKFRIRRDVSDSMQTVQARGGVMRSLQGFTPRYEPFSPVIGSSSLAIEGSISMGRLYERRKLDAILLGKNQKQVSVVPWPSPATMDTNYDQTGFSFGGAYPTTAAETAATIGFGTWQYGWNFDDAAATGSITASYSSSPTLPLQFDTTAGGNARYGIVGPLRQVSPTLNARDLAVGFTGSSRATRFDGGNNFSVVSGSDLLFAYVARFRSVTGSFGNMFGKVDAALARGWVMAGTDGTNYLLEVWDGSTFRNSGLGPNYLPGEWHVGIGAIDRSLGRLRFGIRSLETGVTLLGTTSQIPAAASITASSNFYLGASNWVPTNEEFEISALYISTGSNVASGVLPNISQALENFALSLGGSTVARFQPPSWTRSYLGTSQAFVIPALTSTMHEQRVLNAFASGTETLESSVSPATIGLNFSKESRLQTIVVKKTASFSDSILRSGSWVPQAFFPGTGSLLSTVTGSGPPRLSSGGHQNEFGVTDTTPQPAAPASILIPVNVSGKLVDIKIWLEWICVSGSGFSPLATFSAAIRSPNVTWGNAHPIRNDPQLRRVYTSDTNDFSITAHTLDRGNYATLSGTINPFYRDTFILWESPCAFSDFGDISSVPDGGAYARLYPSWQSDRGMRTVFSDGAACANPRHLNGPRGQNYVGSPNSAQGFTSAYGAQVPWTSDATVPVGSAAYQAAGSPPKGWLNGPGGTADINEWPTTGVNYGTNEIRPLYPLLDGIFQTKVTTNEVPPQTSSLTQALYQPSLWKGFRPGLRGSEISGTWELLMLMDPAPQDSYFRQVRLEITYETPPSSAIALHRNRRRKNPGRAGSYRITRISGSDSAVVGVGLQRSSWDFGFSDNFVVVDSENEIGASFGVTPLTGNFSRETALLYRLTGSLADVIGEAAPDWLFTGPFGMPNIPESSATLSPRTPEQIVSFPFNNFMQPRKTLDGPQRLEDVSTDLNAPQSLRDLAAAFVSSSAT